MPRRTRDNEELTTHEQIHEQPGQAVFLVGERGERNVQPRNDMGDRSVREHFAHNTHTHTHTHIEQMQLKLLSWNIDLLFFLLNFFTLHLSIHTNANIYALNSLRI